MKKFHVSATSHWPNYLPQYIADAEGYFEAEGLAFSRTAPADWTQVLDDLDSGTADVALGGLWVPAMLHERGRELVAFAALNSRNPKVLMMREKRPDFSWSDLEGGIVLVAGAGGTAPYVHTAGVMRDAGVDMSKVRWVRDLSGSMLTQMFLGGHGTAMVTDAINGAMLEHAGAAAIVARHDTVGRMPNSVYYTLPGNCNSEGVQKFCRALQRAYVWMAENSASQARAVLAQQWPGVDTDLLVGIVDDLRKRGIWEDIRIDRQAFDDWIEMQREDGLVSSRPSYEDLVDPRPAEAAVAAVGSVPVITQ